MYFVETGLGDIFKPRSKAPIKPPAKTPAPQRPPKEGSVVADGHRRFCPTPFKGAVTCDLNLKVRFRRSFYEFLRGVENAYGRWMARPTAQMLVKKLHKELKQWHDDMLYAKLLDNDPVVMAAGLSYRSSNSSWHVVDSSLRQWQRLIDL